VEVRYVVGADPSGKLRLEAFFCTDLQATPAQILRWVVMRWAVAVTFEEVRAHLGLETQRQWSEQAIARTTPVLFALFSLITVLGLRLSHDGQIPVPLTAWYHKTAPTFSDCVALVRRPLWRARYVVNSTPEAESMQLPQGVLDLLLNGFPLAAELAKVELHKLSAEGISRIGMWRERDGGSHCPHATRRDRGGSFRVGPGVIVHAGAC
jgi:hypothetical protein